MSPSHVKRYQVVRESSLDTLVREVNEYLRRGWGLHGPLIVEKINGIVSFMQPLYIITKRTNDGDST